MEKWKKIRVFALCLVLLLTLQACGDKKADTKSTATASTSTEMPAETSTPAEMSTESSTEGMKDEKNYYPVTITTYNYKKEPVELTFEKAPEKVLAVYQSAIENLLALGLGDKIIACSYLDVPVKDEWQEQFSKIQYLEDAPSKEAVLEMAPDFIVSWRSYFGEKTLGDVDYWHSKGIKTYMNLNSGVIADQTVEGEFEDIRNMGIIFNKQEEAEKLIQEMKDRLAKGKEESTKREPVSAVILEIEGENQFRNYGTKTIGGNIATLSGANLVFGDEPNFGLEQLIEKDPEAIFTVYFGDSKLKDSEVEKIVSNPALQSLQAVKNKRVYPIMLSEVYAAGVRTADGIKTIVEGLYP